ncbi:MAG: sensor histidine kinase [Oscillospiraceae bacterium]|jgi:signal transduction histidine kinase|nr:sensor histidine kinase [Oscillospiraceae bacterium]
MNSESTFKPLKNKLIRFCLSIFGLLLTFSVFVYGSSQRVLHKSQEMTLLNKSAATYYMGLDSIDRALYEYAHSPSEDLKLSIEAYSEILLDSAGILRQGMGDPIARDQWEIARSYVSAIRTFLENANGVSVTEMLRRYDDLHRTKMLITRLYKTFELSMETTRTENEQQVDSLTRWQRRLFFLLLILLGTLSIVYTKRFSQKLLGPVLHLSEMTAATWNTPDYQAPPLPSLPSGRQDETTILTQNYYRMLDRLSKQMAELREKARLEQQLRLEETQRAQMQKKLEHAHQRFLQSQVNPHFLFNVMSISAELAYIEGAKQTEHLLRQIAVYLRYALSKVDKIVTLNDEKQNIEAYIDIQQIRFGDRIRFAVNFAPACLNVRVPALILQPLVENSISHGVGDLRSGGKIEVSVASQNGQVTIDIADNGQGIPEEKLTKLRDRLISGLAYSDDKEIGLMNVYNRLQLFFDNKARCAIVSEPRVKTCISLTFPDTRTPRAESREGAHGSCGLSSPTMKI